MQPQDPPANGPLIELPACPPGRSLVLGAGGLLGSHVARWLAGGDSPVRLFDLSVDSIPRSVREAPGVEVVQGNLMDRSVVLEALDGVDRVFHLVSATVPSTSVHEVDVEMEANIHPMVDLLTSMREAGTPLIIYPSSGGTVYGDEAPREGFAEQHPLRPACSYGLGKIVIEQIIEFHGRTGGPDFLIPRIANAYGPSVHGHRRQGVINAFLDCALHDRPLKIWGNGTAVRDYVHIDDIVSAMGRLMNAGIGNAIYNVGSGGGHSIREIIKVVQQVVGRPLTLESTEGPYAGIERSVLDTAKIRKDTDWRPEVDLHRGVDSLWQGLRDQTRSSGR